MERQFVTISINHQLSHMVIIVMGVSASGKTTVGQMLARALGWGFSDADDFHGPANIEKMKKGIPLTDEDRQPWLRSLRTAIEQWNRSDKSHILACSALKEEYRQTLGQNDPKVVFVYLQASFDLVSERLKARKGHFFNASLLQSQFEALETPQDAVIVDASEKPYEIVSAVLKRIDRTKQSR
jgi:gluconokinase